MNYRFVLPIASAVSLLVSASITYADSPQFPDSAGEAITVSPSAALGIFSLVKMAVTSNYGEAVQESSNAFREKYLTGKAESIFKNSSNPARVSPIEIASQINEGDHVVIRYLSKDDKALKYAKQFYETAIKNTDGILAGEVARRNGIQADIDNGKVPAADLEKMKTRVADLNQVIKHIEESREKYISELKDVESKKVAVKEVRIPSGPDSAADTKLALEKIQNEGGSIEQISRLNKAGAQRLAQHQAILLKKLKAIEKSASKAAKVGLVASIFALEELHTGLLARKLDALMGTGDFAPPMRSLVDKSISK